MARGLKFQIKEVEELFHPCTKNKGVDVFTYANSRFSHDTAQIWTLSVLLERERGGRGIAFVVV